MDAAAVTGLPHLYRPGQSEAPVLVMLHGTGGNEEEFAALASDLLPHAGVLAPRGPVQEHGMLRWFRRRAEGIFDIDDVIAKAGDLAGFIAAARNHYGLGERPLVAVGFSNGANIALATALLHPQTLDRVIAFSGMYPLGDRRSPEDLTGSRLLVLNGDHDPHGTPGQRRRPHRCPGTPGRGGPAGPAPRRARHSIHRRGGRPGLAGTPADEVLSPTTC